MPKTKQAPSLDLDGPKSISRASNQIPLSPSTMSPTSPRSPKLSEEKEYTIRPVMDQAKDSFDYNSGSDRQPTSNTGTNGSTSPSITAIPQYPPSPKTSPKHGRDPSKSFFSNLMASKSSNRLNSPDRGTEKASSEKGPKSRTSSKDRAYPTRHTRGSTTDLSKMTEMEESNPHYEEQAQRSASVAQPLPSETSLSQGSKDKRGKQKFGGLLQRTRSIKVDEAPRPKGSPPQPQKLQRQDSNRFEASPEPPKTASSSKQQPTRPEREKLTKEPVREPVKVPGRTRSADRQEAELHDRQGPHRRDKHANNLSSSFRDGAGAQLLSNLSQTSRGMGDRLGKAGKGFFGKIARSGSSNERDLAPVQDEHYQCTVITLPLIQQTRRTRIARRLELSKDKTEFWMPALPWRCIDYLNMNGCEEEGLYRIPGSGKEVKHWQRRFDIEHDINLFDEQELYDINIIGSMFKAWLRDLPDEIFPKATQTLIAEKCMGATKTPQLLKDELSKLPPFNYYLLFAITCHLSLLHSFSDKNKMDYRNLCICFQPCLKIDGFCFQFLVQDWKNCWQGCWTEKEYLEEEYRWEKEGDVAVETQSNDERGVSSSESGQFQFREQEFSDRSGSPAPSNSNGSKRENKPNMPPAKPQQLLPEVQIGAPLSPIRIP